MRPDGLFVVRQTSVDGAGAVQCLGGDNHGEVVRQCKFAETPTIVGGLDDSLWQTFGAANDKAYFSSLQFTFLEEACKVLARQVITLDFKYHDITTFRRFLDFGSVVCEFIGQLSQAYAV